MGLPSVHPTGTIIYNPEKAWNGYTLLPTINDGILLIDMNGNEIRRWVLQSMPPKMLPGGHILGTSGFRYPEYGMQDNVNLLQVDYDGNIEWEYDHYERIDDPGHDHRWMARQHHDFQREGQTVYYTPDEKPLINSGKTLILGHRTLHNPLVSDKKLLDDIVFEVDWEGNMLWSWSCSDHFSEFGFDEAALNILSRNPNMRECDGGIGDFLHINCASYLGPNRWYDQGDERFKPKNIIMDSRESNILFIIDHDTGKIVWRLGPDYIYDEKAAKIGQIIGQHGLHMIPKGLPGEGNLLLFDNGGWAGYGVPNPGSKNGSKNALRDYSRILEIDPVSMKVIWSVTPADLGAVMPVDASKFYSPYVSNVQRLPNGNTLIDEGSDGRLIEVTHDHEIVWEWISPYFSHVDEGPSNNMVYRAYRYPYSYVPQEETPNEVAIERVDNTTFRMPNAGKFGTKKVIEVEGTLPYYPDVALCVATLDETSEDDVQKKEKHLFDIEGTMFSEIDLEGFNSTILASNSEKPQLIMFGAERCTHCKTMLPLLEQALKEDFADTFDPYYLNVDHNPELVKTMRIYGTPVIAIFKHGVELARLRGELDYDALCEFIEQKLS